MLDASENTLTVQVWPQEPLTFGNPIDSAADSSYTVSLTRVSSNQISFIIISINVIYLDVVDETKCSGGLAATITPSKPTECEAPVPCENVNNIEFKFADIFNKIE